MSDQPSDLQRLNRYDSTTREYTLAIITDEDHASQVELEDGQVAWQSTLRYDKLHRNTLEIGERIPDRGVSSFKILPGHDNECVALKSIEIDGRTETYLFCFDLDGNVLQKDTFVGRYKCEGVEIL